MASASSEGYILLGMPDMHGAIRGKALRPAAFKSAIEQGAVNTDLWLALDPVDHPIVDYADYGINTGAPDLLLEVDTSTRHPLSWKPGWEICLATPHWPDGSRCTLATRELLRDVIDQAAKMGYEVLSAFEYEVRITDEEGKPPSSGLSYSLTEIGRFDRLLKELPAALSGLGVELDAVHTEAGPGLLELNIAAARGLQAADNAAFVKFAMKELAASLGLTASFLAKTEPLEEGSSGHIHLSLWRERKNIFAPEETCSEMPVTCMNTIGGILKHLPAASLLLNPTINSYKRLVPGYFAPVNVSWGYENRSTSVRAIRGTQPSRSRLECRRPGADANPYLALAALLASALLGIQERTEPPLPEIGDVSERVDLPPLPNSLESALEAFRSDESLRAALGHEFSDYFAVSREWELKAWQRTVTDWERERYIRTV